MHITADNRKSTLMTKGQLSRIRVKVPGVAGCHPEPKRKSLTLGYVNAKYAEDRWIYANTDGSDTEATSDVGNGV